MAQPKETDLAAILAGCIREKRSSQHELYRLYYAYGMSIAIRYVNNEDEAISILNDSFLKVFRNIKKFKTDQPFKPWLRKIIVNTALNHIKKNKKFKLEVNMEQATQISDREEILSRISYKELMSVIQSLSVAYRTVFNMYVIDGYKHEEIAREMGITVSTSKSNLTRAREKLREKLRKELAQKYA